MESKLRKVPVEEEKVFTKTIENSLKLIKKDEINEAYINLNGLERELEQLADQGVALEPELIITTLHNIAFCHQKTGELEESASYIEACIFNAENKYKQSKSKTKSDSYYINRIKQASYLSTMYCSLCVAMSCMENHYVAILHSQQALEYAKNAIKQTIKAANKGINYSISAQKLRKKMYLGEIYKKTKEKPSNSLSYLMMCLKMLNSKDLPSGLIKFNTIDGVKPELAENLNLNSAMKLSTLTYRKCKGMASLDFELEGDEVFKKIFNVVIALYLISSEKYSMDDDKQNAIFIRNKAVAIARTFLPKNSAILTQIKYLDE